MSGDDTTDSTEDTLSRDTSSRHAPTRATSVTDTPLDKALGSIKFDANGLVPAIVQDVSTRAVLMMAWMNAHTLALTLTEGRTVFWSRSRQEIWRKGESSGDRQWLREAYYDCDGDTLLFLVVQDGSGACHTGAYSCFFRSFDASSGNSADRPFDASSGNSADRPSDASSGNSADRPFDASSGNSADRSLNGSHDGSTDRSLNGSHDGSTDRSTSAGAHAE